MRLIKNILYKQRISFSSKIPISYLGGKFGRQRRNFSLASAVREICDFGSPQRTKESEVSRTYNVCNNVKLPHERSVRHSCHSLTLLPYRGCRTSNTYVAPTDRQIISPSECRYLNSYECLAGRQKDAGSIQSGTSFTRSNVQQQHKDRARRKQNTLSLCRYIHSRDQAISGVGIKFYLEREGETFQRHLCAQKGYPQNR